MGGPQRVQKGKEEIQKMVKKIKKGEIKKSTAIKVLKKFIAHQENALWV